jgi:DNA-binding transcriptional LysR family regulator
MDTLDALRLYVTTSTVTVALQQLEAEAGAALITRSTRRLTVDSFWPMHVGS